MIKYEDLNENMVYKVIESGELVERIAMMKRRLEIKVPNSVAIGSIVKLEVALKDYLGELILSGSEIILSVDGVEFPINLIKGIGFVDLELMDKGILEFKAISPGVETSVVFVEVF